MDITSMINKANKLEFKATGRRKKMSFKDFEYIDAYFNDFYRNKLGYVYRMEGMLTQEQQEYILHFKNTKVTSAHLRYAPEIKFSLVLIADKCFKKEDK